MEYKYYRELVLIQMKRAAELLKDAKELLTISQQITGHIMR